MQRVAAVVVTRGDVPLDEILESHAAVPEIAFTYIWDNSVEENLSVYGRYAAIERFDNPVVLVQDDDCVLEPESFATLLSAYQPGVVTANMPARFRHDFYVEHCLVGFGAIFDRDLPRKAWQRFAAGFELADYWDWVPGTSNHKLANDLCDIIFTGLTPRHLVDVPHRDLDWASAPNRMWMQKNHQTSRSHMLKLVRQVRDA